MIKSRFRLLFFSSLLFCPLLSHAQYDEIRFPQKPDEIALFQKNRIMGETQFTVENDKQVPYLSRAFDPKGRVVISVDYYHRKYYLYDGAGNVISYLDSIKSGNSFTGNEYKFRYYDNGKLMEMYGPEFQASFKFIPDKNELIETTVRNDSSFTNIYHYDEAGRLDDALFLDFYKKPYYHFTRNYSTDGRIYNESVTTTTKDMTDSALTIYEYNASKQLFKKQRFRYQVFYFSTEGSLRPDHTASHYDQATSEFNVDESGRPIEEEYTVKGDKLTYRYSTWKYDNNGLITQETNRIGKMEPQTILHKYVYFDK